MAMDQSMDVMMHSALEDREKEIEARLEAIRLQSIESSGMSFSLIAMFATSVVILATAGLIMDGVGVPWAWDGSASGDSKNLDKDTVASLVWWTQLGDLLTSSTMFYILTLCFAAVLLGLEFIPMPTRARGGGQYVMALCMLVTSIFMLRGPMAWFSLYFMQMINKEPGDSMDFHLHFMIYFMLAFGLIVLEGSLRVMRSRWKQLMLIEPREALNHSRRFLNGMILASIIGLLLSLLLPVIYTYEDVPEASGAGEEGDDLHIFPVYLMMFDEAYGTSADDVVQGHAMLQTMFIINLWITASMLLLLAAAFIPRVGGIVEMIMHGNVLYIGLIITMLIFAIIFYVDVGGLDSQSDIVGYGMYEGMLHMNWLILVAIILMIGKWARFVQMITIPGITHLRGINSEKMALMKEYEMILQQKQAITIASPGVIDHSQSAGMGEGGLGLFNSDDYDGNE